MKKKIIVWNREFSTDPGDWKYEDQYTGRKVPMQVLCLGMSRTGTSSLNQALRILGYNDTHHMACCIANAPECDIWLRAIEAKWFGKGKKFEREDWDKLLGYCMATTDLPCIAFAEELITAYPDAKVILNLRPVDSWYRSFNETIMSVMDSPLLAFLAWTGDPFWSRFMRMVRPLCEGFFGEFPGGRFNGIGEQKIKQFYLEHYDRIRTLVPKDRLYEKDITEGWDGICKFLGKDIPKVPYSRVNDKLEFARSFNLMIVACIKRLIWNCAKVLVPSFLLLVAGWVLRFRFAGTAKKI